PGGRRRWRRFAGELANEPGVGHPHHGASRGDDWGFLFHRAQPHRRHACEMCASRFAASQRGNGTGARMSSLGQKQKVFLVDDHPLVREWLTTLINQQPDLVVCGETESAPRALQAIAQSKPDVAIIDISLEDSSGIELIKTLKQVQPGVLVLVLSMHDESLYAERALRAG